jgi:diacylglycerol kinase (ATP)
MRVAIILGPRSSRGDVSRFQKAAPADWISGLPSSLSAADAILIFGGDGTIHCHLPDLLRLKLPVLIAPAGSGNDFARAFGLRSAHESLLAWQAFASGANNVRLVDIGIIDTLSSDQIAPPKRHYFCCVAGVGLDAEVARRANLLPAWLRRHGGYALSLPGALRKFTSFPARITVVAPSAAAPADFQSVTLAAFANTPTFGGGMKIAPCASLTDGLLDICTVPGMNKFKLFLLFPSVYVGGHLQAPKVEYFKAARLRVETELAGDVYADGEFICKTPVEISVASGALNVIVPPKP